MTWNRRTTDWFGTFKKPTRPSCVSKDSMSRIDGTFEPAVNRDAVRDLLFGPKVVAELAILRRLAA
jgi:hypothetical protein